MWALTAWSSNHRFADNTPPLLLASRYYLSPVALEMASSDEAFTYAREVHKQDSGICVGGRRE